MQHNTIELVVFAQSATVENKISNFIKGLVDQEHLIAKQPVIFMISQQLLALRALKEQQILILMRGKIPKLTWILS